MRSGRGSRRRGTITVLVLAAVLLVACDGSSERPSAEPKPASTSTRLLSPSPSPVEEPPRSDGWDEDDEASAGPPCLLRQRKVMSALEWPLLQVLWLVSSAVDGRSQETSRMLRRVLSRQLARLREDCSPLPAEIAQLREDVWMATAAPVDGRRLGNLEDAFDRWARRIGERESDLHGASAVLRHCNELERHLRAGYAVWWDYAPNGRRWWVQLVVENDTAKRRLLGLGGVMWVTGLPSRNRYARHDGRGGEQLVWGGSSADSMIAAPWTRSSRRVPVSAFGFVHTSSEGRVYGVRPEIWAHHRGASCSLPVPRLN